MKRFLLLFLSIFFSLVIILLIPLALLLKPFLPYANYLLGVEKPIHYLILLGNDAEMRANGGFAGSYAKITLDSSLLPNRISAIRDLRSEISFQDIYVPNGQLDGHVTPPAPIQEAFGHGTWELANADWEPDFPTAATTIRWFLNKGQEVDPDLLAIINLSTIKKVLDVVGPFPVAEYNATLTPENLYLFLQGKAEVGFFPGSTQKKDALSIVGQALAKKTESLSLFKKIKIAQILYSDLKNQNILLNSTNSSFQNLLDQKNFSGSLKPTAFDSYSLIETNLGANKANAYITRQTTHQITTSSPNLKSENRDLTSNNLHHQVTVTFHNSSPEANPNPPFHYGGNYIAYLRFYLPSLAQNISFETAYDLKSAYGFTEIGFWHTTSAGTTSTINLSYDLPLSNQADYSLAVLKQHGLVTSPQEINLFGQVHSSSLIHSQVFTPRR